MTMTSKLIFFLSMIFFLFITSGIFEIGFEKGEEALVWKMQVNNFRRESRIRRSL
jgi:hypothetical protein